MNPGQHITAELLEAIASARFNRRESCAWESIDPLTKFMLRATVHLFLTDTIPALLEAGWEPPQGTHTP